VRPLSGSEIVKLPLMSRSDIDELLDSQNLCRIAFKGVEHPYIAPFQYVRLDDTLYFHFTNYGRKMRLLEKDKRVSVEVEKYNHDMSEYGFIVFQGSLKVVQDQMERSSAIEEFIRLSSDRLSENFLVAHGFKPEDGWSVLNQDKSLVIMKLVDVSDLVGLKYPE
jgi:nitroimidazol reductase NimA-like FMN-containing flavoprotein (pyridoxamine 5'-phosphate oxidase superfamily)